VCQRERFHSEWNRSRSYFASNFFGLESLHGSGQADIAPEPPGVIARERVGAVSTKALT